MLIAEFLVVIAILAFVLAIAFVLTDEGGQTPTLWAWWRELVLSLLSFPSGEVLTSEVGIERGALQLITAIGGLVLPALFIGAVVLKLFISPDLFTMRDKIVKLSNAPDDPRLEPGGHHIAVRGYSSTPFTLLNVCFSAIIRFEQHGSDGTTLLLHRPLRVANPDYAIAHPHVPYTLTIPIDGGDWTDEPGGELADLQGFPVAAGAVVIVLISGTIPQLGTDFTEAHDFPLVSDLSEQPYAGLTVDYNRPPWEWDGWKEFDES